MNLTRQLFDFRNTDLGALAVSLPTQASLVFFAIVRRCAQLG